MIPQFEEIRIQALRVLSTGVIMRAKDLRAPLAKYFNLSEDEMNAWYPSGNGEIFLDRISWALSYLFIAGLVEKPKRGDYKISNKGLEMLSSCTDEQINEYIKGEVNAKTPKRSSKNKSELIISPALTCDDERTPQERLDDSYNNIKQSIQSEILATILSKKPQDFERLVVDLLQAMGYGGEIKNSGVVTKRSNDGGIDGIIKEDILGFNHISIQAKRYASENNVGRNEVQSFVGAVAGTPSKKGVFITTSNFTKGAVEYVESLNGSPTIILINGHQLTEYIYDFGLGLQTEKIFKVMKMDMDYWDSLDDDK
ncbi:restriction endonuclease [uncultured Parabacteroides sp.]|uniref:restriction endonuclease n=1 Tax=uncultured Parabacteroides sp. TaxID=512312 RepID=UPI002586A88E|nr:restriction endonuclease [uncultured Parabacteroides sp.]